MLIHIRFKELRYIGHPMSHHLYCPIPVNPTGFFFCATWTAEGTSLITTLKVQISGYYTQWKGFSFSTPSTKCISSLTCLVFDCEFRHISRLVKTRSSLWCDVFQSAAAAEGVRQDGDVYLISVSLPVVIGSCERGDFNHRRAFVCDGQAGNDI